MSVAESVGKTVLRIGSTGHAVEVMQLALRDVGFPLRGTGYFANATDTAVREFQKRAGLKPDGAVGMVTATAIDAALRPNATVIQKAGGEIARPLWLQAAIALVGTRELAGGADNQVILQWARDEGGDIAKEYTHDSIPWCALFVNHTLTKVSLPGTETLWALDFAGKWPSVRLDGPAVGAIAPMLRNGGGHVMEVVGRAASGNIVGVGGNQHDSVCFAEFAPSRLNRGFWWPESVRLPTQIGFGTLPLVNSDGRVSTREA